MRDTLPTTPDLISTHPLRNTATSPVTA